jgi:S-adenosylmethionine:tRNA ribosyltransferase-isomerase
MNVSDFDYELPQELIAQVPAEPRDSARLLVHDVGRSATEHRTFRELAQLLAPGDLLVVNDTRVRRARLLGKRRSGGAVELLVLGPAATPGRWRALTRPAKRLREGEILELEDGAVLARACARSFDSEGKPGAEWTFELSPADGGARSVEECLEAFGRMPLPPYIRRPAADAARREADGHWYQTVFAHETGAVAAPTAGLHFTRSLLEELEARGVARAEITLHVGAGTFQPVTAAAVEDHVMHVESFRIPESTVAAVEAARARGGRVIAVGTTSARALESASDDAGRIRAGAGETRLFITPGYRFRVIDALITNFHLPRSTLLMLVSAFVGREAVLERYADAIARRYRFFSYGDAMLLLGSRRSRESPG